ncbi:MAG: FecR domain-containing protein [Limisphaerales bacterium]
MKDEELDLLHSYLDGGISPEELETLEDLLRSNAKARSTLRSLATIDAKWQELETKGLVSQPEQERVVEGTSFGAKSNWLSLGAIAAALVVGVFVLMSGKPATVELGIARVIRVEGNALMDGKQALADEDELFAAGRVSMTNGFIELAFRESGVHVVAGAPLSMRLDDPMRLFLEQGEIKLVVPPQGIGFVVDTADQEIVDLGTSFILKANPEGSEVLVLDGQITVGKRAGDTKRLLMSEGEFATFDRGGKIRRRANANLRARGLPEVPLRVTEPGPASLRGKIMSQVGQPILRGGRDRDFIGGQFVPLIQSRFQDQSGLELLPTGAPLRFAGIAGAFASLPEQARLERDTAELGWMAWYRGRVVPPRKGRFRFWGYADNHLVVAMDGKPVFEGSRDSPFSEIGIPRTDNPALPCLIARAGFANGPWIESKGEALQLDILFGEIGGILTSGLLLIEWEGQTYDETFWGQPKWPIFMTEAPNAAEVAGLESVRRHLEEQMMGSFSIATDAIWKVNNGKVARQ